MRGLNHCSFIGFGIVAGGLEAGSTQRSKWETREGRWESRHCMGTTTPSEMGLVRGRGLGPLLFKGLHHAASRSLTFLPPTPACYIMAVPISSGLCLHLDSSPEVTDMHVATVFTLQIHQPYNFGVLRQPKFILTHTHYKFGLYTYCQRKIFMITWPDARENPNNLRRMKISSMC